MNNVVYVSHSEGTFVKLGFGIKKMSPFEYAYAIYNANGYIPTPKTCLEKGYKIQIAPWALEAGG